jgi:hypothetical protein
MTIAKEASLELDIPLSSNIIFSYAFLQSSSLKVVYVWPLVEQLTYYLVFEQGLLKGEVSLYC